MTAKDLQIQALLSDIKTQQTVAADAVALSKEETSRAKLECNELLAAKDAKVYFPSRSKQM